MRRRGDGRKGSTGPCATVVIPLLNALAAGGCAKGRSVEKRRKGEGRGERECLGSTATAAAASDGKRTGIVAKRTKSGVPQSTQRGELKVYRPGSTERRLPVPCNLRKQRSMTNLAVLTDAEKKLHLYEPKWCDDMTTPGTEQAKTGKPKMAVGSSSTGGGAPLSRNLSKSEHSLCQGKSKPFNPLAAHSALSKQSRIPRGPCVEVKPLSKAPEDRKSNDEILSSKAKAKNEGAGAWGNSKGQREEFGDKPFLKVDPELVVTVLGDLEQLLFSQMLDPESQRKRTVQNVLDLRQNLEDTMSRLRGSQLTHSNMGYDSDETNARSISSLSNRSSPLSWHHGQSSPRLQAGDAPSSVVGYQGNKAGSRYTAHTMPTRCSSRLNSTSHTELMEGLDMDDTDFKSGYLSDSDLLGKSLPDDDLQCWDDSSSISSGLSEGDGECSENLSSEEFNASSSLNSLPSTPLGSRRSSSVMLRTDAEKHSLVESGLSWYSEDSKKLSSSSYDTGSLKTEAQSKWRKKTLSLNKESGVKGNLRKPLSLSQPGSFRKGRHPPVGVTCPITHTSQSTLKVAGKPKRNGKNTLKTVVKMPGLQRSQSDAGKDHHADHHKPPSGFVKPNAGASFGYKKQPTATVLATLLTAGGANTSSDSATVGKSPKPSVIPVKPLGGVVQSGRKNSFDASSEQNFLGPNARNSIQYRSLPRPAKSSTLSVIGRTAPRPASGTIDSRLLSLKPMAIASVGPRFKESGSCTSKTVIRTISGPVNQTDREKEKERAKAKAVGADVDCGSLKGEENQPVGEPLVKLHGLLQKSLDHTPSLVHLDKVNSNSLDSCITIQDLPPKVPPYSKLQDLAGSHNSTHLTPSQAPVLHIDSPTTYTTDNSPLMYPKISGMHYSMESLSLQMSLPPRFVKAEMHDSEERGTGTWGAASKTSYKQIHGQYGSSLSETEGSKPGRRHSHTVVSMTESDSPPQLPSPTHSLHPSSNKAPLTNVVVPISSSTPRILRSNSIGPPTESACNLYGSSHLDSSMTMVDQPKSMMRCGSFREQGDDVHGSVLSLASNASSNYSTQIHKLRRELESSQEKVANLTLQLSANANLVAAFEQSLSLMTERLQTLSVSSEQKDSELTELKGTIDILKVKNTEAQEIIQGAFSNPAITPKEMPINWQNSSESILKLPTNNSKTEISSLKELEAKRKKKKSWLRSSFNKAFNKKGSKSTGPYADIEEIATPECSAPSSPKVYNIGGKPVQSIKRSTSASSSGIYSVPYVVHFFLNFLTYRQSEVKVADDKVVSELRTELWEKELKLTDIRLEALGSAHHLEQLQDAMNNMQEVKQQELFIGTVRVNSRMDWVILDSAVSQAFKVYIAKVDPTSSLGLSTDSIFSYSMGHIKRVLGGEAPETLPSHCMSQDSTGITLALKGLKEKCVDSLVFETLIPKPMMQHYISLLLKHRRLVLSGPSGTGKSYLASRLAEYLVDRSAREVTTGIAVTFNMHRQSCKDLQLYLSNLANQIDRESSMSESPLVVILDDIHDPASISELVNGALTCKYHKCPYIIGTSNQPIKMTANHGLHLSFRMVTFSNNVEPANGFLVRYLHRKLMESEHESSLTNDDLIRVLDWVPKLWYHLHTFLEKHSTSDFLIGPCFFLSCPITVDEFRSWFIDLWNYSIIPYLQEGAKDGIKVHGQKAGWEDPVEWVRGTLPWPSAQQDQAKLFHLPPPSIDSSSPGQSLEEKTHKETPPSSMESDPLMAMLLKLQEAANYIESPEKEDPSLPKL
uniref:Neuron navigator 1 n=1 Tax=Takifugu rubripes TaxID=31033 RepID=H2S058_TAKRU